MNLKKYFPSKTMSNFFSYITLEADMKKLANNNLQNNKNSKSKDEQKCIDFSLFETIIDFVKNDFKQNLQKKKLLRRCLQMLSWAQIYL